jgi:hypothetical protein
MRNSDRLQKILRHGVAAVADFVYGINAGSAIRHGLPVPPQRTPRPRSASLEMNSPARRLDPLTDVRV